MQIYILSNDFLIYTTNIRTSFVCMYPVPFYRFPIQSHRRSRFKWAHSLTCGQWLPLHAISLQGCTSFRLLTFHSVHCLPSASVTHDKSGSFPPFLRFPPNSIRFPGFPKPAIPKTKPGTSFISFHPIAPFQYRNTLVFCLHTPIFF